MIAKGNTHNNGGKLAAYMTTAKEGERVELGELRGFVSETIKDAFRDVQIMAQGTQCEQPFFHVQVRNPEGEMLLRDQWDRVADRIGSKLGLSDQPHAVTFHINEATGHEHMHVAWSRIDEETMTAKALPFFKERLKEVSRELETELGLTPVTSQRRTQAMAPSRAEDEQARRLNVDIRDVRDTIRESWERSDNGKSFAAALAGEGLTLAKGDRRDFVVIDQEGGMHALGKRVLGTTAAETRARCSDIDRENLPTVEQAREQTAARQPQVVHAGDLAWENALAQAAINKEKIDRAFVEPAPGPPPKPESELKGTAAEIREAFSSSGNAASFAAALEPHGIRLAIVTVAEADQSRADGAAAAEHGRHSPEYRAGEVVAVNALGHVYRLNEDTSGNDRGTVEKFLSTLDRSQFNGVELTQQAQMMEASAFSALSRVELLTPRTDTTPASDHQIIPTVADYGHAMKDAAETLADAPVRHAEALISEPVNIMNEAISPLASLAALIGDDKPAPPPTKEIGEALKAQKISIQAIDSERLLHDRAYRRAYEQQQREEREHEAERQQRERKERDDRQR